MSGMLSDPGGPAAGVGGHLPAVDMGQIFWDTSQAHGLAGRGLVDRMARYM